MQTSQPNLGSPEDLQTFNLWLDSVAFGIFIAFIGAWCYAMSDGWKLIFGHLVVGALPGVVLCFVHRIVIYNRSDHSAKFLFKVWPGLIQFKGAPWTIETAILTKGRETMHGPAIFCLSLATASTTSRKQVTIINSGLDSVDPMIEFLEWSRLPVVVDLTAAHGTPKEILDRFHVMDDPK